MKESSVEDIAQGEGQRKVKTQKQTSPESESAKEKTQCKQHRHIQQDGEPCLAPRNVVSSQLYQAFPRLEAMHHIQIEHRAEEKADEPNRFF
jgi:hypothetical protein